MRNALTILGRDAGQTFRSPLAYVFLVLFVVLSQVFYVLDVFTFGRADLRPFMSSLPWFIVVFAALATMRSFAEERQENTFEMLMTFPMRDRELVAGKFGACFVVLAVSLALTVVLPVMLFAVGDPDPGPMLSGYLGALLLSAMWCAAGVFLSSITRSQLLAAMVCLVLGLASLLAGSGEIAQRVDGKVPGLGTLLLSLAGTWPHYDPFTRGVIELSHVLFFVAWTAVFLFLTTLFVGQRREPGTRLVLSVGTLLAIGCGLCASRTVHDTALARIDLTEEGLYTLSDATLRILERTEAPVRVKLYISPTDDMPTELKSVEQEVVDRLGELRAASGGRLEYRVIHMQAAELVGAGREGDGRDGEAARSLEERLAQKGIQPFAVQERKAAERSTKLVYSTIGITYREKDEQFIRGITPRRMPELEYLIASAVARLTRERPPRVALVLGPEALTEEQEQQFIAANQPLPVPYRDVVKVLRREQFDVVVRELSVYEPLPEEYDALVVIGPIRSDERQRWEISRALAAGKPTLIALQRWAWDYSFKNSRLQLATVDADSSLEDILYAQGVGLGTGYLMDSNAETLTLSADAGGGQARPMPVKLPMHIRATPAGMNQDSLVSRNLPSLLALWATPLELDAADLTRRDITAEVLVSSSESSWIVPSDRPLDPGADLLADDQELASSPIAVLLDGQFKNTQSGVERPAWPRRLKQTADGKPIMPPDDPPAAPLADAPGRLIAVGTATMFRDGILGRLGNANLLINAVHALTMDDELLRLRGKRTSDRRFGQLSDTLVLGWTVVALTLAPLLVIALGLITGMRRLRGRERWNASHGR